MADVRDQDERVHRIGIERIKYVTNGKPDRDKIRVTCKAITIECLGLRIRFNIRGNGTTEFFVSGGTEERRDLALRLIHERLKGRPPPDMPTCIVHPLTAQNVKEHNKNITDKRQFACQPCQRVWWRKVFSYKPVSRCDRCQIRYDPVPKEREYGYGVFRCERCGNVFTGRAQAGVAAPCFKCAAEGINSMCMPSNIGPRSDHDQPYVRRYKHACARCDNGRIQPCPAFNHVIVGSTRHESTGSTVSTFLTQQSEIDFEDD